MLHLSWVDIRFNNWLSKDENETVEFDSTRLHKLWVPDLFFPNEKKASVHNVFMPNKMLRVYTGGKVSYTSRLSLTLSCPMYLHDYPFDKQTCSLEIESFSYNMDNIVLKWMNDTEPVQENTNIIMNQFEIKNKSFSHSTINRKGSGMHSVLRANFYLGRNILYYLVQMYIPSILVVMLSWISFWLNTNAVPGRISLGVLTVLTMTQQSSTVNASLPRVSYTKAIDIWMSTCLVFVTTALIEFAVANWLSRKDINKGFSFRKLFMIPKPPSKRKRKGSKVLVDSDGGMRLDPEADPTYQVRRKSLRGAVHAMNLDIASRFLFPFAFGIFNIVYWSVYLKERSSFQ
ncbi:hypothetical protein FSP39_009232 [Pinctada imbricata]|uniref:Glycine receptor subunit alpha-2 n=1 Tax=Pinctada imbricata TaxID=66713 RepID=A0AA88YHZ6_PINIB|nr:hypothetical protein FSP39_009232 [Pinctada imbricata]